MARQLPHLKTKDIKSNETVLLKKIFLFLIKLIRILDTIAFKTPQPYPTMDRVFYYPSHVLNIQR